MRFIGLSLPGFKQESLENWSCNEVEPRPHPPSEQFVDCVDKALAKATDFDRFKSDQELVAMANPTAWSI